MAFTRFPDPTNNISNLANQPVEPPATLKQKFDQVGEDLKDWNNNTFLPELESIANGDSGADNIGATPVGAGVAENVQGVLEELDAKIDTQLPTPDGSITDAKLSNSATALKQRFANLKIVNVLDFGAVGDGVTNDRNAFQSAFDSLVDGSTLFIPYTSSYYKIVNATGNGATKVIQRADALLNNTVYPITCNKNNITIVVNGVVKSTSLLANLFEFSGQNVSVVGQGGEIKGLGGSDADGFLDTNSDDPLLQWKPTLIKFTGDFANVSNITITDPPTVGIQFNGKKSVASDCVTKGGIVVHGVGTILFGIELVGTAENSIIKNNFCIKNSLNGMVYDAVFNVAPYVQIINNQFTDVFEHGVYNYGDNVDIIGNTIDGTLSLAGAIQSFAENTNISKNRITNAISGGISVQRGKNTIISENTILGVGIGGITFRTFVTETVGYSLDNIVVTNNIMEFDKTKPRQSGIDIQITYGCKNVLISKNTIISAMGELSPGIKAGMVLIVGVGYVADSVLISENFITDCDGYGAYFTRLQNSKVSKNILIDNGTTVAGLDVGIRHFYSLNVEFSENFFNETRTPQKHTYAIYEDTGSLNNMYRNNTCFRFTQANPFRKILSPDYMRFGNRKKDMPLEGIITMINGSSKNFVNADSNGIDNIMTGAQIQLIPLNNAAALLQGSSKRLLVTAIDGAGIMQVQTADASVTGVATAQFRWIAIQ